MMRTNRGPASGPGRAQLLVLLPLISCLLAVPILSRPVTAQVSDELEDEMQSGASRLREGSDSLAREIMAAMPASEDLEIAVSISGCEIRFQYDYSNFCERDPYYQRTVDHWFDVRELASSGPVLVTDSQSAPGLDALLWRYSPAFADSVREITQELLDQTKPHALEESDQAGQSGGGKGSDGRRHFPPDSSAVLDEAGINSRAVTTTCDGYQYVSPEGVALTLLVTPGRGQSLLAKLHNFRTQCSTVLVD